MSALNFTADEVALGEGIFTGMSMPDHYAASPDAELADAGEVATERRAIRFTPPSRRPERVADEVTRLIHEGEAHTFVEPQDYADLIDLDYIHSDLPDRPILPFKVDGYTTAELREELIQRGPREAARREALVKREQQYLDEDVAAAISGPGSRIVIPHFKGNGAIFGLTERDAASRGLSPMPDGTPYATTRIAYPVPNGYTPYRVARKLAEMARGCWWDCEYRSRDELCAVMLVSTGGSLRMFATCQVHRYEFGPGPDYYLHDRRDEQHGYPAECRR